MDDYSKCDTESTSRLKQCTVRIQDKRGCWKKRDKNGQNIGRTCAPAS